MQVAASVLLLIAQIVFLTWFTLAEVSRVVSLVTDPLRSGPEPLIAAWAVAVFASSAITLLLVTPRRREF